MTEALSLFDLRPPSMALPDTDRSAQCHARDARARVLAALAAGRQWVAVVDPAGFDKTAVLRDAERALAAEATATMRIATEPGQPSALLVETGEHGTAFVDNAERLSGATLARFAGTGMLQCVFAGPPELVGKLMDHVAGTELMMLGHAPVDPDGIAASTGPEREGGLPDVAAVPQPTAPPGHEIAGCGERLDVGEPKERAAALQAPLAIELPERAQASQHPMTPVSPLPVGRPSLGLRTMPGLGLAAACIGAGALILRSAIVAGAASLPASAPLATPARAAMIAAPPATAPMPASALPSFTEPPDFNSLAPPAHGLTK